MTRTINDDKPHTQVAWGPIRHWKDVSREDMDGPSEPIDPALVEIVDMLMDLDPAARHQTMYELDAARVYPFDTLTKYVHQRLVAVKVHSIMHQRRKAK